MAKRVQLTMTLTKFLGKKKTDALKKQIEALYFNPRYWRAYSLKRDTLVIKATVCKDKKYKVELLDLDWDPGWERTPNNCTGLFFYFPYRTMNEKEMKENFELQWKVSIINARIKQWLREEEELNKK